jgi:ATP-dependent DNA ligase
MNILYPPARCTASLPENLDKPYLVSEPKMDGSRYVLYLNHCPYNRNTKTAHTLLSRRPSVSDNKFVDRSLNVPHIANQFYEELSGTVLDGEIMADNFEHTNSIMNSSPSMANQKQKELGLVTYHVFDVLSFRGKDVRGYSLEQRRKILETVVSRMDNPYVKLVPQFSSSHIEHFNQIVSKGGEGIIVKDLRQGYGSGWSKFKKSYDISCFISGFKEGNGKYKTSLGSLALSVFDDKGKIVEVGFASGFDDSLRSAIARDQASYYGRVVDVFAQEFSKDNRLRHPTFHRIRDDLNREDCTIAKLRDDMKKRSMFKREK